MSRIQGVNHLAAVRALEKAGFQVIRQGKHVVMSDGTRQVTIPRHNPVKAFTLGGIVRDAGLTPDEFRRLLGEGTAGNEFAAHDNCPRERSDVSRTRHQDWR